MAKREAAPKAVARTQQFIRLYPDQEDALAEWNEALAPGIKIDRSRLIRMLIDVARPEFRALARKLKGR